MEVVLQNQLPSYCGSHRLCLTERSSTIIGVQKRQSSSVVASVAINLAQLYEDVNLSTVKMHPSSGDTQSGQNVDPFVDDEVISHYIKNLILNGYDNSMLDVDMEDNFISSSETLDGTLRSNGAINERDRKIVTILRNMLDKYNSLAKNFCYARDRYQQKNCINIKLKLISKRTTDSRTYNLPSASEVAALIVGDVEQLSKDRDIIIESQSKKLQRIDVFHPSYLALQYPLLFSTGESPLILRSRRLFQQFLVDAYTMVESKRLKFFRYKQPQLRVDKYTCLHESLINGDVDAVRLGKRIILPSTFTGGPRYAGYPSYFITMTCNPEWDEIKRELTPIGLKAEDRPDILCRLFKNKLDGLIDDLKEEKIFGKIFGCKSFQKRGFLHAHIFLFMSNEFKPQTPDDIDKHITVEIPDENERPNLHGAVQNYMDDKEFIDAIKEASSWDSGSYVRRLFVILLTSNNISRPEHVSDRCWHELSDDILYRQRAVMNMRELIMSDDEIKQLCIMDINKILFSYGKTLKDYPPMPLTTEVDTSLLTERVLKLTKNMRLSLETTASDQDETEQFGEWLLKVGDGLIGDNMDENMSSKDFFKARTILAPTLDIVEEVNNHLMTIIPGGEKLYLSSDSICMDEGNMESQLDLYGPKLLNSINYSGLSPHKLILEVGVPVMLLRNINQSSGFCNGTRLQVRKLRNHVIECEVLTGNNVGHIALIPRMNMVPTNETVPVRFQRRQFP
ncbi:uncharacterized protein [Arachis hypogaea]|uniref:uncharacterized protein n=1 Tax=Arachis hypogaea TaxID=3818 RepID=UPI003B216F7A